MSNNELNDLEDLLAEVDEVIDELLTLTATPASKTCEHFIVAMDGAESHSCQV